MLHRCTPDRSFLLSAFGQVWTEARYPVQSGDGYDLKKSTVQSRGAVHSSHPNCVTIRVSVLYCTVSGIYRYTNATVALHVLGNGNAAATEFKG